MPHDYEDLRRVYAELALEGARQALLEAALERARQGVAGLHYGRAGALAPYAAYPEHGDAYLEEAGGLFRATKTEEDVVS